MSIGGSGSSGSSQTQLDPQIKADWQGLYGAAQNAFTPGSVPQQQVAGFTADQKAGQSLAAGTSGMGEGAINSAVNNAGRLATSTYAPSVNTNRTVGIGGAGNPLQLVQAPSQGNLAPYENPYTSDVFNTTLNQLDLARREALNSNSSTATLQGGEGAWNGTRAGVADSLTNRDFLNTAASTAANLNQGNFAQAQQAAQTYGQMGLQAAEQNQNTAANVAQNNQQLQETADIAQAGFNNDTANRQLAATQLLGGLAPTQQGVYSNAANTLLNIGGQQQQQQQHVLDASYNNALQTRLLPIQTVESAFGIIPKTDSGSVTHSSSKSGGIGNS